MARIKDHKKVAEKLQKEISQLKIKVKESYEKGFEAAYAEMEKMEALYEKHMVKAENEFYKKTSKKPAIKKSPKKTGAKKGAKTSEEEKAVSVKPAKGTSAKKAKKETKKTGSKK